MSLLPPKYFPWIHNSRNKFYYATKLGLIERPNICSKCNKKGDIHGHHEDYHKPFEVIWLCQSCHFKRHYEIKKEREIDANKGSQRVQEI